MTTTKSKVFALTKFSAGTISTILNRASDRIKAELAVSQLIVELNDESIETDDFSYFSSQYSKNIESAIAFFRSKDGNARITISFRSLNSRVSIQHENIPIIDELFLLFERELTSSKIDKYLTESEISRKINVFIGHGRDKNWRELKDHLTGKHGFNVTAYETGARAGRTITDILEEMRYQANFAVLVFSSENEHADGSRHARENVIHEAGLFQGQLGFRKAIVLIEEGCEVFSNISGVQYIQYSKSNIREAFGDVVATIRREFFE